MDGITDTRKTLSIDTWSLDLEQLPDSRQQTLPGSNLVEAIWYHPTNLASLYRPHYVYFKLVSGWNVL